MIQMQSHKSSFIWFRKDTYEALGAGEADTTGVQGQTRQQK